MQRSGVDTRGGVIDIRAVANCQIRRHNWIGPPFGTGLMIRMSPYERIGLVPLGFRSERSLLQSPTGLCQQDPNHRIHRPDRLNIAWTNVGQLKLSANPDHRPGACTQRS